MGRKWKWRSGSGRRKRRGRWWERQRWQNDPQAYNIPTSPSLVHMPATTPQPLDLLIPLLQCLTGLPQLLCLHLQVSIQVLALHTALGTLQWGGRGREREGREEGMGEK